MHLREAKQSTSFDHRGRQLWNSILSKSRRSVYNASLLSDQLS